MFFSKVFQKNSTHLPTSAQPAFVMAETHVLTTSPILDFDDYPYDADGKSLLPPTNISSMVIDAGEAAKSRRRGRLSSRSLPTVALVNETVICEAAKNVEDMESDSREKNIGVAFTQIPKSVRVLRRICAVHRITVAPIVTLLWNDTPPRTDSPESVPAITEDKSLLTAREFIQPTEESAVDHDSGEKSQYDEDSAEARLEKHGIVCPMGWRPHLIDPEPAYSYIQYVKPLPTIKEKKESRPVPKIHHIGPSPEELIAKCDALAEQVKSVFPVDDAPVPSTSHPQIPPRPQWITPAAQLRPATFAPFQPLNGPAGIGPYRGPMFTSFRRLEREHEVASRNQTASRYPWLPESVSSTIWGAETSNFLR
ncbi:hypothetical protein FRC02_007936 [Tulasnella sp. 418]|nr:hypothetical protein FRC02_007936 [Tulasnella sp. 418]